MLRLAAGPLLALGMTRGCQPGPRARSERAPRVHSGQGSGKCSEFQRLFDLEFGGRSHSIDPDLAHGGTENGSIDPSEFQIMNFPPAIITAEQVIAARDLLGWSVVRLAGKANIGEHRLRRFEAGLSKMSEYNRAELERALQEADIEFGSDGKPRLRRS